MRVDGHDCLRPHQRLSMRLLLRLLPPVAIAAAAAWLALPGQSYTYAYTFLGGSLDLGQRDVRVHLNFTDAEATDDTRSDPNFPGATSVALCAWKAVAEWGSLRRCDGHGDPTQPPDGSPLTGLGSGGANFDAVWQGLAPTIGGPSDNVISQLSGAAGGVLAFCETPIADGWRIRVYADAAIWHDDVQGAPQLPGHKDLQGVLTHEYGHALGLDHDGLDPAATMFPSAAGTANAFRSIEGDDRNGVQALYGVAQSTKPRIDSYELVPGGIVRLLGLHFAPSGNEVWLTRQAPNADGTPVKISGLTSSGTQLEFLLPAEAGAGDVLVKIPGDGGSALSNAFAFDPSAVPLPEPQVYGIGKTNSLGLVPRLVVYGRPRVTTGDFALGLEDARPNAAGVLFWGTSANAAPFLGGTLYVVRPLRRETTYRCDFAGSAYVPLPVSAGLVGTTRRYQMWYSDPAASFGAGLSNAVLVVHGP